MFAFFKGLVLGGWNKFGALDLFKGRIVQHLKFRVLMLSQANVRGARVYDLGPDPCLNDIQGLDCEGNRLKVEGFCILCRVDTNPDWKPFPNPKSFLSRGSSS